MSDKTWSLGVSHNDQHHYQIVLDCTYWPLLGSFNNWNIINFTNKGTSSENFDDINKIVLDGMSDNMYYLVQTGKYDEMNTTDTKKWDVMSLNTCLTHLN